MSKRVAAGRNAASGRVKACYGIVGRTLNRIAHAIGRSQVDRVCMRHEEADAFAASAEAFLTGHLTACVGTWDPGGGFLLVAWLDMRQAGRDTPGR